VLELSCEHFRFDLICLDGLARNNFAASLFENFCATDVTARFDGNRLFESEDTPERRSHLFMVSNQSIAQTVLERAEPGLVILPLEKPISENRLANLL
jgi:hypothetical protein